MRRLDDGQPRGREITIDFEGQPLAALEGEPLAVALVAAGEQVFSRSAKYHRPRGPYCFSAACSNCLMRVDGVPNVFTCRTPARAGMRLERQNAYPSAKFDVYGATDWMFPRGMDHHAMFAGVPIAQQVMSAVARHLSGLGKLPDSEAPPRRPAEVLRTTVAIAGGGPAGLAAARALTLAKVPFVLVEREGFLGGRLETGVPGPDDPKVPASGELSPGAVRLGATALGLYEDEAGWFLPVLSTDAEGSRLALVYAERFLVAVGGHPRLLPFVNNDLPGVLSSRAASTLLRRHRVLPGSKVALVGEGAELYGMARLLSGAGAQLAGIVDREVPPSGSGALKGFPERAHGRASVRALTVQLETGGRKKLDCDAVVVCLPPSPGFELARQAGAKVSFDGALRVFVVEAGQDGRTAKERLFVAGDVTGPCSARAAAEAGQRAASAIAHDLQEAG
ncbi:MAG: 2Fe-2S iron-sulfur cluster-binding protein [Myxococcaceae bacterium]